MHFSARPDRVRDPVISIPVMSGHVNVGISSCFEPQIARDKARDILVVDTPVQQESSPDFNIANKESKQGKTRLDAQNYMYVVLALVF